VSVPAGLLDGFAAVMLLVAAVSAARLLTTGRPDADIDVSHLLMGIAMAGTLTASLRTLPSLAWEIIFAALTLWFAGRVTREYRAGRGLRALVSEHHAPHLLHSAAMLYMFLALRPASGHAGSAMAGMPGMAAAGGQTLRLPTLALLFAFLLCAYVVADLDRVPAPHHFRPAPAPTLALAGVGAGVRVGVGAPPPAGLAAPASAGLAVSPTVGLGVSAAAAHASTAAAPATPAAATTPTTSSAPATPSASPAPSVSATPAASPAAGLGRLLSPGVARGCRIAMGVTMAFMLIIMI
jgi:hypothetical protein